MPRRRSPNETASRDPQHAREVGSVAHATRGRLQCIEARGVCECARAHEECPGGERTADWKATRMSIDSSRIDIHVDVTSEAQVLVRRDDSHGRDRADKIVYPDLLYDRNVVFRRKASVFAQICMAAATRVRRESMTSTECSRREHHVIGCWRPRAPARATASAFLVLTSPLRRDCDTNVAVQ